MTRLVGAGQLRARLTAIKPDIELMAIIQRDILRAQKELVPVKTGNLRRTIMPGRLSPATAETLAQAAYAGAVEYGTKPHEIVPRNARVLAWPAPGVATTRGGRVTAAASRAAQEAGTATHIFARRVNHPGTRAQPFMRPGLEKGGSAARIRRLIVERWNGAA